MSGKLTDERFAQLSGGYDIEQKTLMEMVTMLSQEIDTQEQQTTQVEEFIQRCKKYSDLQALTPTVLNDLVNRVYVQAPDKSSGKRRQRIDMSYNFVGILPPMERFRVLTVEQSPERQEETA